MAKKTATRKRSSQKRDLVRKRKAKKKVKSGYGDRGDR